VAFDQNEDPHWPHCLHYLHQVHRPSLLSRGLPKVLLLTLFLKMIVCKADGQLEKQHMWNFSLPFVSGAEDVRECGDSQRLFDLFESQGN
jgi:hypothetical protein